MSGKIWVISELYYPEEVSTGHFMTKIAEGLAQHGTVNVLCSQPTYAARGTRAPWREEHNGVHIERCRATALNKDVLPLRVINLVTISLSIFFRALVRIRRGDVVLVVTNPPLLPFTVSAACRLRGAKCVLRIDDVYPDVLVAGGLAKPDSLPVRAIGWMTRRLYKGVEHIVVLGRDMARLVRSKLGNREARVSVIPNWADLDLVGPMARDQNPLLRETGLMDKFVLQCAGNMGRAQGIENIFRAAEILKDEDGIRFLFIGAGSKVKWMENEVREKGLTNVVMLGQRPRSDQPNFLNACDVALASLMPGMTGVSVPSRAYNIMAAGKPIVAVTEPGSELSLVVEEEGIGWVVPPDDPEKLAAAIREASSDAGRVGRMGELARAAAVAKYSAERSVEQYCELLGELAGIPKADHAVVH